MKYKSFCFQQLADTIKSSIGVNLVAPAFFRVFSVFRGFKLQFLS